MTYRFSHKIIYFFYLSLYTTPWCISNHIMISISVIYGKRVKKLKSISPRLEQATGWREVNVISKSNLKQIEILFVQRPQVHNIWHASVAGRRNRRSNECHWDNPEKKIGSWIIPNQNVLITIELYNWKILSLYSAKKCILLPFIFMSDLWYIWIDVIRFYETVPIKRNRRLPYSYRLILHP